jgi:hypothetical protein
MAKKQGARRATEIIIDNDRNAKEISRVKEQDALPKGQEP